MKLMMTAFVCATLFSVGAHALDWQPAPVPSRAWRVNGWVCSAEGRTFRNNEFKTVSGRDPQMTERAARSDAWAACTAAQLFGCGVTSCSTGNI